MFYVFVNETQNCQGDFLFLILEKLNKVLGKSCCFLADSIALFIHFLIACELYRNNLLIDLQFSVDYAGLFSPDKNFK